MCLPIPPIIAYEGDHFLSWSEAPVWGRQEMPAPHHENLKTVFGRGMAAHGAALQPLTSFEVATQSDNPGLQGTVRSQNGKGTDVSITGNHPLSACRPFTLRRRLPVLPSRGEREADGGARYLCLKYNRSRKCQASSEVPCG